MQLNLRTGVRFPSPPFPEALKQKRFRASFQLFNPLFTPFWIVFLVPALKNDPLTGGIQQMGSNFLRPVVYWHCAGFLAPLPGGADQMDEKEERPCRRQNRTWIL